MTAGKVPQPPGVPTPEWEEVRQENPPSMHPVPVQIQGIVPSWALPAKRSVWLTHFIPAAGGKPVEIVPGDPRIKHAIIFSNTSNANFLLGTEEQVNNGAGFDFGSFANFPPFEGFEEPLYAVSFGAAASISVQIAYWAD